MLSTACFILGKNSLCQPFTPLPAHLLPYPPTLQRRHPTSATACQPRRRRPAQRRAPSLASLAAGAGRVGHIKWHCSRELDSTGGMAEDSISRAQRAPRPLSVVHTSYLCLWALRLQWCTL